MIVQLGSSCFIPFFKLICTRHLYMFCVRSYCLYQFPWRCHAVCCYIILYYTGILPWLSRSGQEQMDDPRGTTIFIYEERRVWLRETRMTPTITYATDYIHAAASPSHTISIATSTFNYNTKSLLPTPRPSMRTLGSP